MYVINRLRPPGKIKSIRLGEAVVKIRLVDGEVLVYRRIENEDVGMQDVQIRRRTFPPQL